MDEFTVIGYRDVSFKTDDNVQIDGIRLFLTAPGDPTRGVVGESCTAQFVSSRVDYDPVVGDRIRLSFNRYGKVQSIEVI